MNHSEDMDYKQAVYLDDTALVALMDPHHPHHNKARAFFLDLDDLDRYFVTTSYILFDIHEWLRDKSGYRHAEYYLECMDKAVEKGKLVIVSGNSELEKEAKSLLIQCPQYRLSLGEAVTAVVMLSYHIKRIFTFNGNYNILSTLHDEIRVIPTLR